MNRLETFPGFFNILDEEKSCKLNDLSNFSFVNCPKLYWIKRLVYVQSWMLFEAKNWLNLLFLFK
jgi:hypothetical protein